MGEVVELFDGVEDGAQAELGADVAQGEDGGGKLTGVEIGDADPFDLVADDLWGLLGGQAERVEEVNEGEARFGGDGAAAVEQDGDAGGGGDEGGGDGEVERFGAAVVRVADVDEVGAVGPDGGGALVDGVDEAEQFIGRFALDARAEQEGAELGGGGVAIEDECEGVVRFLAGEVSVAVGAGPHEFDEGLHGVGFGHVQAPAFGGRAGVRLCWRPRPCLRPGLQGCLRRDLGAWLRGRGRRDDTSRGRRRARLPRV